MVSSKDTLVNREEISCDSRIVDLYSANFIGKIKSVRFCVLVVGQRL